MQQGGCTSILIYITPGSINRWHPSVGTGILSVAA